MRNYEACIGRFSTIDRYADKYAFISPYQYGANNPIMYVDVNGDSIRVGDQVWTPGKKYEGNDKFIQNVFSALNSLFENIQKDGAGNVKTKEAEGNVILDFVGSKEHDVNIRETTGTSEYTEDGNINWNPNEGLHVNKPKKSHIKAAKDIEGDISPTTMLAHEFAHAWLDNYSPKLKSRFNNSKEANSEENVFVLKQERAFVASRKETGFRYNYNPAEYPENLVKRNITNFKDGNIHTVKVDFKKRF